MFIRNSEWGVEDHHQCVINLYHKKTKYGSPGAFHRFAQEADIQQECLDHLSGELRWLESQVHPVGPHFLGPQFSLVDAALLPWFQRLAVLKHFRGYSIPDDVPKLKRWAAANLDRASVKVRYLKAVSLGAQAGSRGTLEYPIPAAECVENEVHAFGSTSVLVQINCLIEEFSGLQERPNNVACVGQHLCTANFSQDLNTQNIWRVTLRSYIAT